jgi:hypothetical protein
LGRKGKRGIEIRKMLSTYANIVLDDSGWMHNMIGRGEVVERESSR